MGIVSTFKTTIPNGNPLVHPVYWKWWLRSTDNYCNNVAFIDGSFLTHSASVDRSRGICVICMI